MAKILANRSYDTITNGYMLPSPLVNSKLPDGKKVTNDVIINNPREFEVYFIALELCDFKDVLQDFLIFPVNPTSLTKIEPVSTNIKKTFGGISVTKTDEFIPQSITLQGTFGRSFMTLGGEAFYGISGDRITENALQKMFQKNIKTGFGVTKILQDICKKSRGYSTDDLRPNILYFHNHAFSESYMCEVRSIRFFQTIETNMIWNYELELDIVGIVDFKRKFSLTGLTEKVKNYQFESTSRRIFGEKAIEKISKKSAEITEFLDKAKEDVQTLREPLELLNAPLDFAYYLYKDCSEFFHEFYLLFNDYNRMAEGYRQIVNSILSMPDTIDSRVLGVYNRIGAPLHLVGNYIKEFIDKNKDIVDGSLPFEMDEDFESIWTEIETLDNILNTHLSPVLTDRDTYRRWNWSIPVHAFEPRENLQLRDTAPNQNKDEWEVEVALNNRLKETGWTLDEAYNVHVPSSRSRGEETDIKTVARVPLYGEELYGRDINQNFGFTVTNGEIDLNILGPKPTFIQTVNILTNLKKNDNPEFPNDGIDKRMLQNRMTMYTMFPIMKRNMNDYIGKDDTIRRFEIRDISFNQDAVFMKLEFYSQLNQNDFSEGHYIEIA